MSDARYWTHGDILALLPAIFDYDNWLEPPKSEGRSTRAPSEGGNWIATLADLSRVYGRLDVEDRNRVYAVHVLGRTGLDTSPQVKRLHLALGGPAPGESCPCLTDEEEVEE